jgi:hypothetical protein
MYHCGADCACDCVDITDYGEDDAGPNNWALGREFDTRSFLTGVLRVVRKYESEGSENYRKLTNILRLNAMSLQCLHGAAGEITRVVFECNMNFEILQYLSEKLIAPMTADYHVCDRAECSEFLYHAIRNNRFDYLCDCYNHISLLLRRNTANNRIDHLYHVALYAMEQSGRDLALQWLKEFGATPTFRIFRMIRDANINESSRQNWFAKMLHVYPRYDLVGEDEINQEAKDERAQRFGKYLEAFRHTA